MRNVIARDFSFARDFRSICWGPTVWYNFLRAAATGCVLLVIAIFLPKDPNGPPLAMILLLPVIWPIAYVICLIPIGLILLAIAKMGVPFIGLSSLLLALMSVSLGDPLLCIVHKFAPGVVPIDRPPLMSLNLIYFLLKPEETEEFAVSNQMKRVI